MPFLVPKSAWNQYKRIISKFLDEDSGKQKITWYKAIENPLHMGEDLPPQFYAINMEVLCYYNAFRNWPINTATVSGELDEENLSILVSKDQIGKLGYLNKEGYWDFNWASDRFELNGILYKPSGDTQVAQAHDEAIVFMVILKRDRDSIKPLTIIQ